MKPLTILIFLLLSFQINGMEKFQDKYGRDYFVELPEGYDSSKKYWLFVIVHGYKQKGDQIIGLHKKFAFKDKVITVSPSFPWSPEMGGYYQGLGGNSDKQLIEIFKTLSEKHNLHDRMLLWGHSGGSQYTHRFAMVHHKYVLACASSSGGTWGAPSKKAAYIPFAISCGEKDTSKSVASAPMGRLDWYRSYREQMLKSKMFFTDKVIPDMGHGVGKWCYSVTDELFSLATTGLYPGQRETFEQEINKIKALAEAGDKRKFTYELNKLKNFKFNNPEYSKVPVDDTAEEQKKKFIKVANEYGFTTNSKAEKYLKERYNYYLDEIIIPELKSKMK